MLDGLMRMTDAMRTGGQIVQDDIMATQARKRRAARQAGAPRPAVNWGGLSVDVWERGVVTGTKVVRVRIVATFNTWAWVHIVGQKPRTVRVKALLADPGKAAK